MSIPQLFGIVPTGQSVITTPTTAPSETSFLYALPSSRPFNHIVVFLLPGVALPPDTAAAVYLAFPSPQTSSNSAPNFKFLGGIGPGKESAIFKVSGGNGGAVVASTANNGEVDMDAPEPSPAPPSGDMILGISIESAASVSSQMAQISASKPSTAPTTPGTNNALVVAGKKPDTLLLAQRIIKNAFNFLASFSGNVPVPGGDGVQGMEVVPLKAFEEWWRKFEGRVRSDAGFLERDAE